MKTSEVIATLSSLSYKPGWTFEAERLDLDTLDLLAFLQMGDKAEDCDVRFKVTSRTVDTDRDCAERGYDTPKVLEWDEPMRSSDFKTQGELLASVFGWLMAIELHESREFFRVKSDGLNAPFHPHRPEGIAAWESFSIA